ncbi:HTH-type transcriptional activator RhaS [bioreactor metagenome]|uniref:HTH-type transcriptional activator RhaS n=1 Tax=bioreactor metagenome TaxID=1076179 RepID=A0A644ZRG3_9ZZZZ
MAPFLDIHFPRWGFRPDYYLPVTRQFEYYAVNFEAEGELDYRWSDVPDQPPAHRMLRAPVVWITRPGGWRQYRRRPDSRRVWRHWFVAFEGREPDRWAERGLLTLTEPLAVREPARLEELFGRIIRSLDRGRHDQGALGLLEIFLYLQEEAGRGPGREALRLERLLEELRTAPEKARDWKATARALHWSEAHFRRCFAKAAGEAPVAFLNRLRLNRAAQLICDRPDLPLKLAALECGFDDIFYFSKMFRRQFGHPPGAYRREYGI